MLPADIEALELLAVELELRRAASLRLDSESTHDNARGYGEKATIAARERVDPSRVIGPDTERSSVPS